MRDGEEVTGEAMPTGPERASGTFRATLWRVVAVQVITLLLLWLIQARYTG